MTTTLEQVRWMRFAEITGLSAPDLLHLQQAAVESLNQAQALKDVIDGAIALKFGPTARDTRARVGKDTGLVHFEEDGIRISVDLPKKPEWDQKKLTHIVRKIAAEGDDPAEHVEITYKVPERKYGAWPIHIREVFAPARTLNKTGDRPRIQALPPHTVRGIEFPAIPLHRKRPAIMLKGSADIDRGKKSWSVPNYCHPVLVAGTPQAFIHAGQVRHGHTQLPADLPGVGHNRPRSSLRLHGSPTFGLMHARA